MKLTVPTNWENDLIEKINKPYVDTIYGKLNSDFIGGGRASCVLLNTGWNKARKHITEIHQQGLQFYYLLNSSCLGNREWSRAGQKSIDSLLNRLSKIGVDGVVVSSPYLLKHAKSLYPGFKISVSVFANVNSVEKARFWEELGVSVITLSQFDLNRNFRLLEKIRKSVKTDLQLIANDSCIQDCPISFYHNNISSHSSQSTSKLGSFMFDYCSLLCRYRKILNPENFIRGTWIRPEDIIRYENIGIERFKLTDRTMDSQALEVIVAAYSKRNYKGNLYDLLTSSSKSLWRKKAGIFHKLKYFLHPFSANILKLFANRKLIRDIEVYIDNSKLDGFLDNFIDDDCRYKVCSECGYCRKIADKVIKIKDCAAHQKSVDDYRKFLDLVTSGSIFKY